MCLALILYDDLISSHHYMDELEHSLLFLREREDQLVSMGLKETGDVLVPEAIRQVCHFEAFPNFVSHKPVFRTEDKSLCLHEAWMDSKTQL